jgi:beta-glucosidase-like glycosyl hydrolase/CubicO group peptidase (beta-lactamase class C family)
MKNYVLLIALLITVPFNALLASGSLSVAEKITNKKLQKKWVDSVFQTLSDEEKIGQLFMVAAYSNKDEQHHQEIEKLIKEHHIGGLIFFQGGPHRQAVLTNRYQAAAQVPLLIAIDAEWGLAMRLDSTMRFPKEMTLGALQDNKIIYKMGKEIAQQCRRMGIHINFAPVVDVNSNPHNPVIGYRAFGEDKIAVAEKGVAYMKGLQENGVIAVAKHFPGHGDTDVDSHVGLPLVKHNQDRISEVEMYPFRKLVKEGVMGVMVAHLQIPAYETAKNMASTLSPKVVTGLLKKELHFNGLIFTDALNMKAVSKYHKSGELEVLALQAGNDILLFPENVPAAIEAIKEAIIKKRISQKELDRRVKKILAAKYGVGLGYYEPISTQNLYEDLHSPESEVLLQELYEKSITLVQNEKNILPFRILDTTQFVAINIGSNTNDAFQKQLSKYAKFKHLSIPSEVSEEVSQYLLAEIGSKKSTIVLGIQSLNNSVTKNFGVNKNIPTLIETMRQQGHTVVVVAFGNAYSLHHFKAAHAIVCAYENVKETHYTVPQALFGAIPFKGFLPVSVQGMHLPAGIGYETQELKRLRYASPESVGVDSRSLARIDSIVARAIRDTVMPGCQIVVAKKGVVIYQKSFGYQTYEKTQPVTDNTIYDLASITKVAATMQAVMFLQDRGYLDVNAKASDYLPELKKSNKKDLVIRDILMHQAGLVSFIPYWVKTVKINKEMYYCHANDDTTFTCQVAPGLFAKNILKDSVWSWTVKSDLRPKPKKGKSYDYKYSDIGFYVMHRIAEKLLNEGLDEFVENNIYKPLGMSQTLYNPLREFPDSMIAPTEEDCYFRQTTIRGTVHDQGAAMIGGVAGHAGLFGNANDLAILMQMHLQKGYYGGVRYYHESTIPYFTKKQSNTNRRALGWDKPVPGYGNGSSSNYSSKSTFGHTGFTGTSVWADPDNEIIYVFLSNRTYPTATNNKLTNQSIRPKIHDIIYEASNKYRFNQAYLDSLKNVPVGLDTLTSE